MQQGFGDRSLQIDLLDPSGRPVATKPIDIGELLRRRNRTLDIGNGVHVSLDRVSEPSEPGSTVGSDGVHPPDGLREVKGWYNVLDVMQTASSRPVHESKDDVYEYRHSPVGEWRDGDSADGSTRETFYHQSLIRDYPHWTSPDDVAIHNERKSIASYYTREPVAHDERIEGAYPVSFSVSPHGKQYPPSAPPGMHLLRPPREPRFTANGVYVPVELSSDEERYDGSSSSDTDSSDGTIDGERHRSASRRRSKRAGTKEGGDENGDDDDDAPVELDAAARRSLWQRYAPPVDKNRTYKHLAWTGVLTDPKRRCFAPRSLFFHSLIDYVPCRSGPLPAPFDDTQRCLLFGGISDIARVQHHKRLSATSPATLSAAPEKELYEFNLCTAVWRRLECKLQSPYGSYGQTSTVVSVGKPKQQQQHLFVIGGIGRGGHAVKELRDTAETDVPSKEKDVKGNRPNPKQQQEQAQQADESASPFALARYRLLFPPTRTASTQVREQPPQNTLGLMSIMFDIDLRTGRSRALQTSYEFPRAFHTATSFHRLLYVFGGVTDTMAVTHELLAVDTETYSVRVLRRCRRRPCPRFLHSAVKYGNWMVVFGGFNANNEPLADCWAFDMVNERWEELNCTGSGGPRAGHAACVVGNRMLIVGGFELAFDAEGADPTNTVAELNLVPGPDGKYIWRQVHSRPALPAVAYAAAAPCGDHASFILCGGITRPPPKEKKSDEHAQGGGRRRLRRVTDSPSESDASANDSEDNNAPVDDGDEAVEGGVAAKDAWKAIPHDVSYSPFHPTKWATSTNGILVTFPTKPTEKHERADEDVAYVDEHGVVVDPNEMPASFKAFVRRQDDFLKKRNYELEKEQKRTVLDEMEGMEVNLYLTPEEVDLLLEKAEQCCTTLASFKDEDLPGHVPDRERRIHIIVDSLSLMRQARDVMKSMKGAPRGITAVRSKSHRKKTGQKFEDFSAAKPFRRVVVLSLLKDMKKELKVLHNLNRSLKTVEWEGKQAYIEHVHEMRTTVHELNGTIKQVLDKYIQNRVATLVEGVARHQEAIQRSTQIVRQLEHDKIFNTNKFDAERERVRRVRERDAKAVSPQAQNRAASAAPQVRNASQQPPARHKRLVSIGKPGDDVHVDINAKEVEHYRKCAERIKAVAEELAEHCRVGLGGAAPAAATAIPTASVGEAVGGGTEEHQTGNAAADASIQEATTAGGNPTSVGVPYPVPQAMQQFHSPPPSLPPSSNKNSVPSTSKQPSDPSMQAPQADPSVLSNSQAIPIPQLSLPTPQPIPIPTIGAPQPGFVNAAAAAANAALSALSFAPPQPIPTPGANPPVSESPEEQVQQQADPSGSTNGSAHDVPADMNATQLPLSTGEAGNTSLIPHEEAMGIGSQSAMATQICESNRRRASVICVCDAVNAAIHDFLEKLNATRSDGNSDEKHTVRVDVSMLHPLVECRHAVEKVKAKALFVRLNVWDQNDAAGPPQDVKVERKCAELFRLLSDVTQRLMAGFLSKSGARPADSATPASSTAVFASPARVAYLRRRLQQAGAEADALREAEEEDAVEATTELATEAARQAQQQQQQQQRALSSTESQPTEQMKDAPKVQPLTRDSQSLKCLRPVTQNFKNEVPESVVPVIAINDSAAYASATNTTGSSSHSESSIAKVVPSNEQVKVVPNDSLLPPLKPTCSSSSSSSIHGQKQQSSPPRLHVGEGPMILVAPSTRQQRRSEDYWSAPVKDSTPAAEVAKSQAPVSHRYHDINQDDYFTITNASPSKKCPPTQRKSVVIVEPVESSPDPFIGVSSPSGYREDDDGRQNAPQRVALSIPCGTVFQKVPYATVQKAPKPVLRGSVQPQQQQQEIREHVKPDATEEGDGSKTKRHVIVDCRSVAGPSLLHSATKRSSSNSVLTKGVNREKLFKGKLTPGELSILRGREKMSHW